MISGSVTSAREAAIVVRVVGPDGDGHGVPATIDTGFDGFLTLPWRTIQMLRLPLIGNRRATLADGTIVTLDIYRGAVQWHDMQRRISVIHTEGSPLVGMALLEGSKITIDVVAGGTVSITPLG